MPSRRDFVKLTAAATALGASRALGLDGTASAAAPAASYPSDRGIWTSLLTRIATPVLSALAERKLKETMPVEAAKPADRARYTHLEALGRTLAGLAPWLSLGVDASPEGQERARFAALARSAVDAATDPSSPDFLNFKIGSQPLVDAAFLAEGILRAPTPLWVELSERVRRNVIAALTATRAIKPPETNWLLFASMVEAALHRMGATVDESRLHHGLEQFDHWYLGDGTYGDGPTLHADYYNSFVIHPMLVEVLDVAARRDARWQGSLDRAVTRLTRYAAIQERLIAPDGSYPATGRSITYRCGAFHALALAAWRQRLPQGIAPAQCRTALNSVIRRTLEAPGTFDRHGWLTIGLAGHQPSLAESYISTGSLYLCTTAFLPLGLPATDAFWSDPATPTTNQGIWSGRDALADHALKEK